GAAILLTAAPVLTSGALALEPAKAISQFGHDTWTRQNGFPAEAVYEIVNTREGYLWLRTSRGLVRFDGARFVPVTPGDGADPVKAIARNPGGELLIRGVAETRVLREGEFQELLPAARLLHGSVRAVFQTRDRRLWIGTDNDVYAATDAAPVSVIGGTGWVNAFLEDRRGDLWSASGYGLHRYSGAEITTYAAGFSDKGATALAEDGGGALWVGTRAGLFRAHEGRPVADSTASCLDGRHVTALLVDRNGSLWAGTGTSGLYRLAAGRCTSFRLADGLQDDGILSFAEDREGSLWVGTRSGLERFRDTKLTPFTEKEGLAHDEVATVLEARDGSLFVFCDGGGLSRFKDGVWKTYATK
ncbi:MAG: ligand-binding sensor domain-containing protein, partial [Gaiellaceae bacterium]